MVSSASNNKKQSLDEYKLAEYIKLGFTKYQANRLISVPGLDVGSVRTILKKGCTAKLAYRIYRP